jgi:NAD(P)-dependent dehydrogenase (short-subunit alcohol dehydrogenase family)
MRRASHLASHLRPLGAASTFGCRYSNVFRSNSQLTAHFASSSSDPRGGVVYEGVAGSKLEPVNGEQYFKDQVMIITGGSTGMGGAMTDYFAQRGARVFNLDVTRRQDTGSLSRNVKTIHCNVANTAELKACIANVLKETDHQVDYLLAHAGIHRFTSVHNTPEDVYQLVVDVNIKGVFFAMQAVLPAMMARKSGSIVITGSDQVFIGKGMSSVYGLSKAAVGQLTKSTAAEYAPFGIRCNCVCPGTIHTPMVDAAVARFCSDGKTQIPDVMNGLATAQPIQRLGRPEEVSSLIKY